MKPGTPPGGLADLYEEAKTEATENSRALCFQNLIISRVWKKGKYIYYTAGYSQPAKTGCLRHYQKYC